MGISEERAPDRQALLSRDYWLIWSTPAAHASAADIEVHVDEHLAWLLKLEAEGIVFLSGPLTGGPGTAPGSGVTVLRADTIEDARELAEADPFVVAGLRTFEIFGWRVNEGAIRVQLSLGTGTYAWH